MPLNESASRKRRTNPFEDATLVRDVRSRSIAEKEPMTDTLFFFLSFFAFVFNDQPCDMRCTYRYQLFPINFSLSLLLQH